MNLPKTETKGQRTHRRILEAAAYCVAEVGIEKTSVTAIAKRAKVSRALVAHYIPKKDRLFEGIVQLITREAYERISGYEQATDPLDKILSVAEANFSFFFENPHYFKCFYLFYYFASIKKKFRTMNTSYVKTAQDRLTSFVSELTVQRELGWDENRISTVVELIHLQMIGAIQKFYIVEHDQSPEEYQVLCLRRLRDLIDVLLSA